MIVILRRGDHARILRKVTSVESRQFGDTQYVLFQPRAMFTTEYLSTYDAIAVVGYGVCNPGTSDLGIKWLKEPRYD